MNDFASHLVSYATTPNLLGVLVDLVVLLVVLGIVRAIGISVLRRLPSAGRLATWSKDVTSLFKRMMGLLFAGAILGDLAFNTWLIIDRRDLIDTKWNFFAAIYEHHGGKILTYLGVALAGVLLNLILLQIAGKLFKALTKWGQDADSIKGNDRAIEVCFEAARWGVERCSWLLLLAVGSSKLPFLPEEVPETLFIGLRVLVVYAVAKVAWNSLEVLVTTLDGLAQNAAKAREHLKTYEALKPLFPSLRRALEATIWVVGLAFAVAQIQPFASLASWGLVGVKVVGLLFVAQVLSTLVDYGLRVVFGGIKSDREEEQRRGTILPLLVSIIRYLIFGMAIVMSLSQVGIDPLPVLAGAGIAGVAVGFGAQSLVADLVTGILVLWEGYFVVGDFVEIGEQEGFVESISLRATRLRDEEGRVHIIPNGKIESIVNYSKEYVGSEIGVGVSYEMDLDEVFEALEEVGAWVGENVPDALEPSEIEGVEEFAESAVIVKLSTKVKPGTHLTTGRVIRKRIKEVFDRRGIEIAYPRSVLYLHKDGSREFLGELGELLSAPKQRSKPN